MSSDIRGRLERLEAAVEQAANPSAVLCRPKDSRRDFERAVMRRAVAALERAIALLREIRQEQSRLPSTTEP